MAINAGEIIYPSDINKILNDIDVIGKNIVPLSWKSAQSFTAESIESVCYGNGKFVVGGFGEMGYSTDGITWTEISQSFNAGYINSISYGNGKFIAAGAGGKIGYCQSGIL